MPRRAIVTFDVLAQIPILLDQGLNASQIARCLGCTVGTLRVRCSQAGISLRSRGTGKKRVVSAGRRSATKIRNIAVPKETIDRLEKRAAANGISGSILMVTLLDIIDKDDLYEAILDAPMIVRKRSRISPVSQGMDR